MHAKGSGAFGTFRLIVPCGIIRALRFLQDPSVSTRFLIRFSTVIGSKGSPDTDRDPRGFAVKFYTSQGNYDVVGLSLPVFFYPRRHAVSRFHPFPEADPAQISKLRACLGFFSLTPETPSSIDVALQ